MKIVFKLKSLVLLSFIGMIFLSFHEKNMLKDFDLRGKVKKVIQNSYSATKGSDGKVKQGPWIDSTVYLFNENGKLTSALSYRGQKTPAINEYYTYDKDGHMSFHFKRNLNTLIDSSFYTFKNGLLVEKNFYGIIHDDISGHVKTVFNYKMDQIITEISLSDNGDTISKIMDNYEDHGKLSKVIFMEMGANKKLETKATKVYSYNNAGFLIGTNSSSPDGNSVDNAWEYNAQGDKITAAVINSIFVMTTYNEYVYDSFGNWIKCTSSFSQEETESMNPKKTPQSVFTRTIIYY